jgi:hypothetical protein
MERANEDLNLHAPDIDPGHRLLVEVEHPSGVMGDRCATFVEGQTRQSGTRICPVPRTEPSRVAGSGPAELGRPVAVIENAAARRTAPACRTQRNSIQ